MLKTGAKGTGECEQGRMLPKECGLEKGWQVEGVSRGMTSRGGYGAREGHRQAAPGAKEFLLWGGGLVGWGVGELGGSGTEKEGQDDSQGGA